MTDSGIPILFFYAVSRAQMQNESNNQRQMNEKKVKKNSVDCSLRNVNLIFEL